MGNNKDVKYAGFGIRILAFLIDGAIFGSIFYALYIGFWKENEYVFSILLLLVLWIYFSYAISKWKATIGKKVLGLEVLDLKLKPLKLKQSTQRLIFSILTYTILFAPELSIYLFGKNMMLWLISILFMFIPIVMMLKSQRKQILHDYLAKTIVININREDSIVKGENSYSLRETKKITTLGLIKGIIVVIIVGLTGYYASAILGTVFVFSKIYTDKEKNYNDSFYTVYDTNDYNDSRIIFYNRELEVTSKEFIESTEKDDIFEYDVKKDLAQGCIRYFLKEHNATDKFSYAEGFRKNARNKYANTVEKIKKYKRNERYMGMLFYYYDFNAVNHIEDELVGIWADKDVVSQTCRKKKSINDIYKMFLGKYIENRKDALVGYDRDELNAREDGEPSKSYYQKEANKTKELIKRLIIKNTDNDQGVE